MSIGHMLGPRQFEQVRGGRTGATRVGRRSRCDTSCPETCPCTHTLRFAGGRCRASSTGGWADPTRSAAAAPDEGDGAVAGAGRAADPAARGHGADRGSPRRGAVAALRAAPHGGEPVAQPSAVHNGNIPTHPPRASLRSGSFRYWNRLRRVRGVWPSSSVVVVLRRRLALRSMRRLPAGFWRLRRGPAPAVIAGETLYRGPLLGLEA